jgi:hypothetical protein
MKLFSLRLTTLKSKLYAIVFASFVVRVVAFFALPNKESSFAPDEGNYGGLTEWIAQGRPADQYYFGGLYTISRPLVVPASLLNRLGLSGLDSVRIVSSLYGLLATVLAIHLLLKLSNSLPQVSKFVSENQMKTVFLLVIFSFLPSNLAWSFVGLRDSAMNFWVLAVYVIIFYAFTLKEISSKLVSLGILLTIPMVFLSRPQVGWAVCVSLLTYLLIKVRVRVSQILILMTLMGMVLGYIAITPFSIGTTETFVTTSSTGGSENDAAIKNLCKYDGQEVIFQNAKFTCLLKVDEISVVGLKNPAAALVNQAESISERQEINKVGAASAIRTLDCPITSDSKIQKYFCLAYRTPYTTYTFLFRPMIGADITSPSSLFAAVENIFWLASFLFVIVMFMRNRRLAFFGALAPSLLFFSIYSVAAGASEGNMGTAFRHKSLILWVVILLLASTIVATQQRKAEQQGISGSSKE